MPIRSDRQPGAGGLLWVRRLMELRGVVCFGIVTWGGCGSGPTWRRRLMQLERLYSFPRWDDVSWVFCFLWSAFPIARNDFSQGADVSPVTLTWAFDVFTEVDFVWLWSWLIQELGASLLLRFRISMNAFDCDGTWGWLWSCWCVIPPF